MRRVAVLAGCGFRFAARITAYAELSNLDMLTAALGGLIERFSLHGAHIGEVVGGAVVTHAKDWNLAREAVIGSALNPSTPAITMMQACGTSLQGALQLGAKIATGQIESGIALGSDTTSDAPIVFKRSFAQRLVQLVARRKVSARNSPIFKGFTPAELAPLPPSTAEPRTGLGMGEHCELMAKEWGITREAQDLLAYESHKKAAAAYDEGFMDDLVIPCAGVFRDNNIRPEISLEKMAELKPVFDKAQRHHHRRQLDPAHRRRLDRAARLRGVGGEAQHPGAGLSHHRPHLRRRLRGGRRAADGADRCRERAPRRERPDACRTSTITRSTRPSPRRCWRR